MIDVVCASQGLFYYHLSTTNSPDKNNDSVEQNHVRLHPLIFSLEETIECIAFLLASKPIKASHMFIHFVPSVFSWDLF